MKEYPKLDLSIYVLIKQVPIPKAMKTTAEGLMDRSGKSMMNPHCSHALEEALKVKDKVGGSVTVLSMGPPNAQQSLKEALRRGADKAYLLSDRKLAGSDTWSTAEALATLIRYIHKTEGGKIDLLFAGLQTIDGDTAHVGPQVAARMDLPQITYVKDIDVEDDKHLLVKRKIENGFQKLRIPLPAMFSIHSAANTPRGPSLLASVASVGKEITIYDIETIGLPLEYAGLLGSPTVVSRVRNVVHERGETFMFNEGSAEERVKGLLEALHKEEEA